MFREITLFLLCTFIAIVMCQIITGIFLATSNRESVRNKCNYSIRIEKVLPFQKLGCWLGKRVD